MNDGTQDLGPWIERLSALHRNLLRKLTAEEGMQFVHVEILQYLSICNHYSNTAQAISEYLGLTKGSISQSLASLEENGFLRRVQDKVDKRIFHIHLQAKGQAVAEKAQHLLNIRGTERGESLLRSTLLTLQIANGMKSFGLCRTCKFNQSPDKGSFVCGLTQEKLHRDDIEKICREHQIS